jgi:hypothetical protein
MPLPVRPTPQQIASMASAPIIQTASRPRDEGSVTSMSKLKEKVEEFAEIAKSLPQNLQVICFDLLLRNHLEGGKRPAETKSPTPETPTGPIGPPAAIPAAPAPNAGVKQQDLTNADLHLKARKFLDKHALSISQLNNLFFKEDGQLKPLYEDLKTTRMSESQIRVTLLLALRRGLTDGEFETDVESVRDQCNQRKCYDSNNFSANYNNNKTLFDFKKFTKDTKSVRLSEVGRKELADIIQELQ